MPEINIVIKANDQASAGLKKVEGELKDVGSAAKSSSSALSGVGNVLKAGLTAAAVGVGAAVGGLVFAFKDSLSAAKESIQVNKQLEQVIKSTGGAAGVTADQARDLAGSLSQVTNFSDDAIVAGENLLLTFTGIGEDVFPRATETMLDMSQALGQDMKSSAVQLGKALNDPINGMTALSRVGVSFTDQQKEMITTMQEAGDVAGAQTVILDELAKEFGGSAKALADPMVLLENAWGEIQETVGMFLVPILDALARTVLPHVQAATEVLTDVLYNGFEVFEDGSGTVADFLEALGVGPEKAQEFGQAFYDLRETLESVFYDIQWTITNSMRWIRLAWDTDWGGIHTTWTEFAADLPNEQARFWEEWNKTFTTGSSMNANDWEGFLGGLATFLSGWWRLTLENWTLSLTMMRTLFNTISDFMKGDWGQLWTDMKTALFSFTDIVLNYIEWVFGPNLRDAFATALNSVWDTLKSWWNNVQAWWTSTVGALTGVTLPTPNFAVVNAANIGTPVGGGGPGHGGTTIGAIHVNVNGGGDYQTGQTIGQGISEELRKLGH